MSKGLKAVFLGTPAFAKIILEGLLNFSLVQVQAVITQPDRPAGRGRRLRQSPVKELALQAGLPVLQPERLDSSCLAEVASFRPDVLLVAAYGQLLKSGYLELAPLGALNVHASLLPKYRGAAPIQRAIINGEQVTGITIMQMGPGMDDGPILLQRALAIGLNETALELHDQLAALGRDLLKEALEKLVQGELVPIIQDESLATYAPKITKQEGVIDWNRPALEVHNQIRGLFPWPGACFDWQRKRGRPLRLKVYPGEIGPSKSITDQPGTIVGLLNGRVRIACQDKYYLTPCLQPSSGKPLQANEFFCGYLQGVDKK